MPKETFPSKLGCDPIFTLHVIETKRNITHGVTNLGTGGVIPWRYSHFMNKSIMDAILPYPSRTRSSQFILIPILHRPDIIAHSYYIKNIEMLFS